MAQFSVSGHQGGLGVDMLDIGSWNPAFRPETDLQDEHPASARTSSTPPNMTDKSPPDQTQDDIGGWNKEISDGGSAGIDSTEGSTLLNSSAPLDSALKTTSPVGLPESATDPAHEQENGPSRSQNIEPDSALPRLTTPADLLARADVVSRTNSFPSMDAEGSGPSQSSASDNPLIGDQSLSHGQPSIPIAQEAYEGENNGPFSEWNDGVTGDDQYGYEFFDQVNTQTKPIYMPPEAAESRYEEGLPLVNGDSSSPTQDRNPENTIDSIFEANDAPEDVDFFNFKSNEPEQASNKPPPFHRKDTSQVLETLNAAGSENESPFDFPRSSTTVDEQPEDPFTITESGKKDEKEEKNEEEDLAERWKAVLDDDELLMDDDLLEPLPDDQPENHEVDSSANYTHPAANQASPVSHMNSQQSRINMYTPHQPSSTDMMMGIAPAVMEQTTPAVSPAGDASLGASGAHAESFSNQSKAGYKSPYDLPIDLKPRRVHRTASHPISAVNPPPPTPPPASQQQYSQTMPPPPPPAPTSFGPSPVNTPPMQQQRPPSSGTGSGNFFEDLPATSRSRPSTRGRYTPQQNVEQPPQTNAMPNFAPPPPPPPQAQTPSSQPSTDQFQLQQPGLIDPYSNLSPPSAPAVSKQNARYSPKPPALHSTAKPSASPRYSPAPPQARVSSTSAQYNPLSSSVGSLPFQPRTSSPLAQNTSSDVYHQNSPGLAELKQDAIGNAVHPNQGPPTHPNFPPPQHQLSPTEQTPSALPNIMQSPPPPHIAPPKRSQTQSPGRRMPVQNNTPLHQERFQRPASAQGSKSAQVTSAYQPSYSALNELQKAPELDFIPPSDGQELDPLERWKGAPIIKFGFGGSLLTSFPKHVPRYTAGQPTPRIKATVGDIKSRPFSDALGQPQPDIRFPGPLRSKSKKKDVLGWLSAKISQVESELHASLSVGNPVDQSRLEEKILLWKVLRVLVEHDGTLNGTPEASKGLRDVLSPISVHPESNFESFDSGVDGIGISIPRSTVQAEPSGMSLDNIQRNLLLGEREKAVWSAVDNRLWGHAMLLSSTLDDKTAWKQVIVEFIRREVRSLGENTEPIAALYEVFAGNYEESVDELVPPSARAGLQMVSVNANQGPAKNALEGLNKWRDTLSLIINNRSHEDHQAITALGRLLSSYGRVEAAHICFLVGASAATPVWGGVNDPHANIVLLGADHKNYPYTFMMDQDSTIASEVYEFAVSVLASSPSPPLHHLQPFKLQHAATLAEQAYKHEAQQYCEAIGTLLKSATRMSPYYNQVFFAALDELSSRLGSTPPDGSSWISKPSMEKVSGSIMAKFNSFIAGDDNDAASESNRAVDGDHGPFAGVTGTPPFGQSPSGPDSYGSYFVPNHQAIPAPSASSRYAPVNQYAPISSPEQIGGRQSLESQRSSSQGPTSRPYSSQRRRSQEPQAPTENTQYPVASNNIYTPAAHMQTSQPSYSPLAPVEEISSHAPSVADGFVPSQGNGLLNTNQADTVTSGNTGQEDSMDSFGGYQGGYMPPVGNTGYEPPSYDPEAASSDDIEEEKPKKKSFMDDDGDDDIAAAAAKVEESEREKMAREAAEIVRKAAEEDGKIILNCISCRGMNTNYPIFYSQKAASLATEERMVYWLVWKERKQSPRSHPCETRRTELFLL